MSIEFTGVLMNQDNRYLITGNLKAKQLVRLVKNDWQADDYNSYQRDVTPTQTRAVKKALTADDLNVFIKALIVSYTIPKNELNFKHTDYQAIQLASIQNQPGIPFLKVTLTGDHILNVLDGRVRLSALQSLQANADIMDLDIPIVLALTQSKADEVKAFINIHKHATNTPTDLTLKQLVDLNPTTTEQLSNREKTDLILTDTVIALNALNGSIWKDKIALNRSKDNDVLASLTSFKPALKRLISGKHQSKVIMHYLNGFARETSTLADSKYHHEVIATRFSKVLNNYWQAIAKLMPTAFPKTLDERQQFVIQKTAGIYTLNTLAGKLLDLMFYKANLSKFDTETIFEFLKTYAPKELRDASFWQASNSSYGIKGGMASELNSEKGFYQLANQLYEQIESNYHATQPNTIEL